MSFSLQTNDTFWCGPASRRRRATKKKWISWCDFFRAKKKLRLYLFICVLEFLSNAKKTNLLDHDIKKNAVSMNLWSTLGIGKKEQKNNNASRVRSEVFLMNFRIVKKTEGIYMKIENDEWWTQKINFKTREKDNIFRNRNPLSMNYI